MLKENLDLDGVDEICCDIENLEVLEKELLELNITFSLSTPAF